MVFDFGVPILFSLYIFTCLIITWQLQSPRARSIGKTAAPNQIIKWVTEGVPVPFESQPPSFDLPNRPLSAVQWDFVNNEIATLLFSGAMERCNYQPVCVSPIFGVLKKGNKLHVILGLHLLNAACTRLGYKNEDIKLAADLVQTDD